MRHLLFIIPNIGGRIDQMFKHKIDVRTRGLLLVIGPGPDTEIIHCTVCLVVLQTKAIRRFVITEKAPPRAFSWLKGATTTFTFKTLLRHYSKRALTPRSLNMKLGPRRNYHEGRAAIRHYANQPARPL